LICGYLGIPLATNVASEEILLDTTVLEQRIFFVDFSKNNLKNDRNRRELGKKLYYICTTLEDHLSPNRRRRRKRRKG